MDIGFVKGIGPKNKALLARLGIADAAGLLRHYPRRYEDRSVYTPLRELRPDESQTVLAEVVKVSEQRPRAGLHLLRAVIRDETGLAAAVWFNQPYLKAKLSPGVRLSLTGRARWSAGGMEIQAQDYEILAAARSEAGWESGGGAGGVGGVGGAAVGGAGTAGTGGDAAGAGSDAGEAAAPASAAAEADETDGAHSLGAPAGKILAVYPVVAGLRQKLLRQAVGRVLDSGFTLPEYYTAAFRAEYNLPERGTALRQIHQPDDWDSLALARYRLVFDEFFLLQMALLLLRQESGAAGGIPLRPGGGLTGPWLAGLPFELTAAQKRVIGEIGADMARSTAMRRLVQGDVGSGKTAVAAWALLTAAENGYQGVMMAPTEILARQHYETLSAWFAPLGLRLGFLKGGQGQKERRALGEALAGGEIMIAVGTHALFQERIRFQRLGLIVIDEQHRFGVRQRAMLLEKGEYPDMLVMSATPIPRTLALTVYGDLDISALDEMPPGRKTVKTICILEKAREKLHQLLWRELEAGNRVFVVCPLIEESEALDLRDAEQICRDLRTRLRPYPVGLLHGRQSGGEKEGIMGDFAAGRLKALVSTTVVEVGVNVPQATVMVVENSERFGLAQLHQLRGRVGRGERQAYCVLVTNTREPMALKRLKLMTETGDGFRLAEADMVLRGPGELFGTRQHGLPEFQLARLPEDRQTLETARAAAFALLRADPGLAAPAHRALRQELGEKLAELRERA